MNESYDLKIADFGPISEASLNLRPLTVFIGPSNTGKSYLAILIYALHQCFARSSVTHPELIPQHLPTWFRGQQAVNEFRRDEDALNSLRKWMGRAVQDNQTPIPSNVATYLYPALENATAVNRLLGDNILRNFGASQFAEFVRHESTVKNATIEVMSPICNSEKQHAKYQVIIGGRTASLTRGTIDGVDSLPLVLHQEVLSRSLFSQILQAPLFRQGHRTATLTPILEWLPDILFRSWFLSVNRPAHYLPAARTGIMHSLQVVVSTLVQDATNSRSPAALGSRLLSGVLADFIQQLIGMTVPPHSPRPPTVHELAERIEDDILNGSIRLHQTETGFPTYAYRPIGWQGDIPLTKASSMVSELAPVVLYLRYVVRSGDLLIIEEPEAHLHPAAQASLARELVRLVQHGVHVLVTTHSEWVLDRFANLVRLSELPESLRSDLEDSEISLRPDQFGAWLFRFRQDGRGSVIKEVPVSGNLGGLATGYDDTADALYNEWSRIGNRLAGGNGE